MRFATKAISEKESPAPVEFGSLGRAPDGQSGTGANRSRVEGEGYFAVRSAQIQASM